MCLFKAKNGLKMFESHLDLLCIGALTDLEKYMFNACCRYYLQSVG